MFKLKRKKLIICALILCVVAIIISLFYYNTQDSSNNNKNKEEVSYPLEQKYEMLKIQEVKDGRLALKIPLHGIDSDYYKKMLEKEPSILTKGDNNKNYIVFYNPKTGQFELPDFYIDDFLELKYNNEVKWLYIVDDGKYNLSVSDVNFVNPKKIEYTDNIEYCDGDEPVCLISYTAGDTYFKKINIRHFLEGKDYIIDEFDSQQVEEEIWQNEVWASHQEAMENGGDYPGGQKTFFTSDSEYHLVHSRYYKNILLYWNLEENSVKMISDFSKKHPFDETLIMKFIPEKNTLFVLSVEEGKLHIFYFNDEGLYDAKEIEIIFDKSIIESMSAIIKYDYNRLLYFTPETNELGIWNMGEKVPLYKLKG